MMASVFPHNHRNVSLVFFLLFSLALLPACTAFSPHAYRTLLADIYNPVALVHEKLTLHFAADRVIVRAEFFFVSGPDPVVVDCRFPGRGYPLTHGLAAVPAWLPVTPEKFTVHAGQTLPEHAAATNLRPVPVAIGDDGNFDFPVSFTNRCTTVRIEYTSRYHRLPDGRACFMYVLTSGAYWRGPIGTLVGHETHDPGTRVRRLWPPVLPSARVEPDFDLVYVLE